MASIEHSIDQYALVRILVSELVNNDLFIIRMIEAFYLKNGWNVQEIYAARNERTHVLTMNEELIDSIGNFVGECGRELKVWCCVISNEEHDNLMRIHVEVIQCDIVSYPKIEMMFEEMSESARCALTIMNDKLALITPTASNSVVELRFPTCGFYYSMLLQSAPIKDRMLSLLSLLGCISKAKKKT